MNRILAFCCHPDDVEWHIGGTLALLAERGYEIHMANMTGGEVGSVDGSIQATRAQRMKESNASAAKIGGQYHFAGGHDLQVRYTDEYLRMVVRVVRKVDPILIFAPPPMDYLIDHEETSRLVRTAAFIASVPNYDCGVPIPSTQTIPHLYYCNATGRRDIFGRPLPLHCMVDISSVIDIKSAMLACHESQREWLRYINGLDNYVDTMRSDSADEGKLIGRQFAEAFIQHLGYGYPQSNLLKEMLGDLCCKYRDGSDLTLSDRDISALLR